jgi:hypothetical protein
MNGFRTGFIRILLFESNVVPAHPTAAELWGITIKIKIARITVRRVKEI